jgi:hypothetical protein
MTPERAARIVRRWVSLYTRGLPRSVARRRIDEVGTDLHDQIAHERGRGTAERRIALAVVSRMLRGAGADASWRLWVARAGRTGRRRTVGRRCVAIVVTLLLLVPLVAMQLTDQVAWTPADFAFAAIVLGGAGLLLEAAIRRAPGNAYRAAAALAIGGAFVIVWANAAVGVVGEPSDPANLMYVVVLAGGAAGASATRCRARGMSRVLAAMALTLMPVTAVALATGKQHDPHGPVAQIVGVNLLLALLFAGSAWLFARAAHRQVPPCAE